MVIANKFLKAILIAMFCANMVGKFYPEHRLHSQNPRARCDDHSCH